MAKQVKPAVKANGSVRDAKTGRFVGADKAKSSPSTTVTEKRTRRTKTVECPDCLNKPGLNPHDYGQLCGTCKGTGKVKVKA